MPAGRVRATASATSSGLPTASQTTSAPRPRDQLRTRSVVAPPVYHCLRYLLEPVGTQDAVVALARRLMQTLAHVLTRDAPFSRIEAKNVNEHHMRWTYGSWTEWMEARSWADLQANHTRL